jgi:hypothetical protein
MIEGAVGNIQAFSVSNGKRNTSGLNDGLNEIEPGAPETVENIYTTQEYLTRVICLAYVSTILLSAKMYHPKLAEKLTQVLQNSFS